MRIVLVLFFGVVYSLFKISKGGRSPTSRMSRLSEKGCHWRLWLTLELGCHGSCSSREAKSRRDSTSAYLTDRRAWVWHDIGLAHSKGGGIPEGVMSLGRVWLAVELGFCMAKELFSSCSSRVAGSKKSVVRPRWHMDG